MTIRRDVRSSVFYLADNYWGSTWYRCHVPGKALEHLGYTVRLDNRGGERLPEYDVLVVQRLWDPQTRAAIRAAKGAGVFTVYDIDDNYWRLHPDNPAYEMWGEPMLNGLVAVMRECDLVTTPSRYLAEELRRFHPCVRVLPNMLPAEFWPTDAPPSHTTTEGEPLIIGWAGSPSHRSDLLMVADALMDVLGGFPDVELHLAGAESDWVPEHERVKLIDFVQIPEYPQILAGFDIAIAPLVDTAFNRSKSDLKLVEYGMMSLPIVASKVGPYVESVRPGENALFAKNYQDWVRHLSRLIEDAGLRAELGTGARAFAERRTIEQHIGRWEKAYGLTQPTD